MNSYRRTAAERGTKLFISFCNRTDLKKKNICTKKIVYALRLRYHRVYKPCEISTDNFYFFNRFFFFRVRV